MIHSIRHLNIEVTNQCNQKCFYCFNNSGEASGAELSLCDWLDILRAMKQKGLTSILVTGGEPFIWPDTINLLREAQDMGLKTSVLSNGLNIPILSRKHSDVFKNLEVAQISLDSMNPEIHDARRGLKGAWKKAIDAIETFRSLQVSVEVSCTVSDENLDELEGIGDFCRSIGMALLVRPMAAIGRACDSQTNVLEQQRWSAVLDRMAKTGIIIVQDRFAYAPDTLSLNAQKLRYDALTVEADGRFRSGSLQNCGESSSMCVLDLFKVA